LAALQKEALIMPKGMKSTPEFRAQAVRQVVEFSRPTREVADDLGVHLETLRTWLKRARDEGIEVARAEESDADAEIRRLRAELKQRDGDLYWKEQEIEFLKKAAGFFAAEQRPKRGSK
jgi:transposase